MNLDEAALVASPAVTAPMSSRVIAHVRESLHATGQAVGFGPWGAGKSVVLRSLARDADKRGRRVLYVTAHRGDAHSPFAAVVHLLANLPTDELESLAEQPRTHLTQLLPWHPRSRPPDAAGVRDALTTLFACTDTVALLVDNAQWLDAQSAEALAHQARTLARDRLHIVVAERVAAPNVAWRLCGNHPTAVPSRAWSIEDTAALLDAQTLPVRWAAPVHRLTGGNPAPTQAMLTDLAARPDAFTVHPLAVRTAARWPEDVSSQARRTLQLAAVARHPTPWLLRLCTGTAASADTHVAESEHVGILTRTTGGTLAFSAGLLAETCLADSTHGDVTRLHQTLANAVSHPAEAARHCLGPQEAPDDAAARTAEQASAWARDSGDRELAAELLLLAAERTPARHRAERLRRLADAVTDAAASGRGELARRVHEAVGAASPGPDECVAALLAVLDTGGQAMKELDDVLLRARDAAQGDPALLAAVELRAAQRANVCGLGVREVRSASANVVVYARRAGDRQTEAVALTMLARMERLSGDPAAAGTLAAALALGVAAGDIRVDNCPQYLAVRFAFFDDRLSEAYQKLVELLPVAQRRGDPESMEEVLRSLAEVAARSGRSAEALSWSEQALETCSAAGLSMGPAWYTASIAQAAGGSFQRAVQYAQRGIVASREVHDAIFTSRSLLALATAQRIMGNSGAAVAALREVALLEAGQGVKDPRVLRWQPELAEALADSGAADEAEDLVRKLRDAAGRQILAGGVGAAAKRAEAMCAAGRGESATAIGLLGQAAAQFADLGLVLEQGRTVVAQGRIECRRRRMEAARATWQQAETLFRHARARPWLHLCQDLLNRLDHPTRNGSASTSGELT